MARYGMSLRRFIVSRTCVNALRCFHNSSMNFEWPAVYSFPPFFTRQVNESVWAEQLSQWQTLVLNYAEDRRLWKLNVAESLNGELFRNKSIDRSLKPSVAKDIISHLVKEGRAEWVVGTNEGVAYIYWKKQEEWADIIYQWVWPIQRSTLIIGYGDWAEERCIYILRNQYRRADRTPGYVNTMRL